MGHAYRIRSARLSRQRLKNHLVLRVWLHSEAVPLFTQQGAQARSNTNNQVLSSMHRARCMRLFCGRVIARACDVLPGIQEVAKRLVTRRGDVGPPWATFLPCGLPGLGSSTLCPFFPTSSVRKTCSALPCLRPEARPRVGLMRINCETALHGNISPFNSWGDVYTSHLHLRQGRVVGLRDGL